MAITSLDGVGAGAQYPREFIKAATPTLVAGRPHSLAYLAGIPGPATASVAGLSGEALTTWAGQLPFTNPGAGETELCRFVGQGTWAGMLTLADRLWQNSGFTITSTGVQTVNSVAFPARSVDGTANGDGVLLGVEVSTITGAGTPTITVTYTNQSGTGSRTGTNIIGTAASSVVGTFYPIGLQDGDTGVRSVQSLQLSSSWTSGVIHLVAYRVIARLELMQDNVSNAADWVALGGPKMYDNTVPMLIYTARSTTAASVQGNVVWTQG